MFVGTGYYRVTVGAGEVWFVYETLLCLRLYVCMCF